MLALLLGSELFMAQYLQLVAGLEPFEAGLWTALAVAAVGFAMLNQVHADGLALLVSGPVVLSLGLAPVFTLATDTMVGAAPPERAGTASAIAGTSAELGGALGIALLGTIGTAVYRAQVADAVPAGVPHETADAARDTLGGAVAAGGGLPGEIGGDTWCTPRARRSRRACR
jgi:DHA2 family multidrug resistance protein-like MFS transporter